MGHAVNGGTEMELSTRLGDITLGQMLNIYLHMVLVIAIGFGIYGLLWLGRRMIGSKSKF